MNDQPKKNKQAEGIKKHAGHYDNAVVAEERDKELQSPPKQNTAASIDTGVGERVSDGRRETYTGNTAAELARQTGDEQ